VPGNFRSELAFEDFRLQVKSRKSNGQHQLLIQGTIGGKKIGKPVQRPIYPVTGAGIADLNRDGQPAVYVFTRIPGPGAYGRLFAFNFAETGYWSQIEVEELPEDMQRGYQGMDLFEVRKGQLLRFFPLHLSDDTQGDPTGGTRTIVYALESARGNFLLKPARTISG